MIGIVPHLPACQRYIPDVLWSEAARLCIMRTDTYYSTGDLYGKRGADNGTGGNRQICGYGVPAGVVADEEYNRCG